MKTLVMKTAHAIKNLFSSWSDALKAAWAKVKIQKALANGVVFFDFRKKDGSLRAATGTTNSNFFAYDKKTTRKAKAHIVTYYDLDKKAFRCFDIRRLLSFFTNAQSNKKQTRQLLVHNF